DLLAVGDQSLVVAQRGGPSAIGELEKHLDQSTGSLVLCVGPEGGWTDQELAAAVETGATMIGLGRHVLRIETAAVALASLVALRMA
ncbi:MAG: RsmE family RNA methyltransferase, partial [Planctomycetota bacterium]|nr:RsmE family RNA methyltransferase [Planctomycetota bacterium]